MIDIVIPVFNEAENIREALFKISSEVQVPYQVHLAYDFDEDTTLPIAKKVETDLGIQLGWIKNKYGRGVLNAIKSAFEETKGDFVVVTMADLSDPPAVINAMYLQAISEGSDLVCGSRYMKGGSQLGGPFIKRNLSRLAGVSLRYLTGFPTHDVTNSFKLYKRTLLKRFNIESSGGFELGMELVIKAHFHGLKVTEVPTSWVDRSSGKSRFFMRKWLPKYLRWYFYAILKKIF